MSLIFLFLFSFCFNINLNYDKNVAILTPENFDSTLKNFDYVLINFYSNHCGHCRRFEPIFNEIGKEFNDNNNNKYLIAKINTSNEKIKKFLLNKILITHLPTIFLFYKGEKLIEYKYDKNERNSKNLSDFLKNVDNYFSIPISEKKQIDEILNLFDSILLFFDNEINNKNNINILNNEIINYKGMIKNFVVNKDLYKFFNIKENEKTFLLLKNFDNKKDFYVVNNNNINVSDVNNFIKFNAKIYINNFDYKEYFNANFYQFTTILLFTDCKNRNCSDDENVYRNSIKKFYKNNHQNEKFNKILNFFKIDINNENNQKTFENIVIKSFKINSENVPQIIIQENDFKETFYLNNTNFKEEKINIFFEQFLNGTLHIEHQNKLKKNQNKQKKNDL
jgi:thiol-disulfide isomerase/thioredoxin